LLMPRSSCWTNSACSVTRYRRGYCDIDKSKRLSLEARKRAAH
jgi:hypothetical protein